MKIKDESKNVRLQQHKMRAVLLCPHESA